MPLFRKCSEPLRFKDGIHFCHAPGTNWFSGLFHPLQPVNSTHFITLVSLPMLDYNICMYYCFQNKVTRIILESCREYPQLHFLHCRPGWLRLTGGTGPVYIHMTVLLLFNKVTKAYILCICLSVCRTDEQAALRLESRIANSKELELPYHCVSDETMK